MLWSPAVHIVRSSSPASSETEDDINSYRSFAEDEIRLVVAGQENATDIVESVDKVPFKDNTRGVAVGEVLIRPNSKDVTIHGRLSTGNQYNYSLANEHIAQCIGKQVSYQPNHRSS
jgi:hypothetical protein